MCPVYDLQKAEIRMGLTIPHFVLGTAASFLNFV